MCPLIIHDTNRHLTCYIQCDTGIIRKCGIFLPSLTSVHSSMVLAGDRTDDQFPVILSCLCVISPPAVVDSRDVIRREWVRGKGTNQSGILSFHWERRGDGQGHIRLSWKQHIAGVIISLFINLLYNCAHIRVGLY